MVKGSGKSSATSGTRKKHAKRAGGSVQQANEPIPKEKKLTKKERGQKKKEPRIKVYVPPTKPAPVQPDPLETTGLVHSLPPELLIILRSFSKKAQVTKIRALEELQSAWIDKCKTESEDGPTVYALVEMLPVWFHHLSALFVHHSRRVRLLTAGVHVSLLQVPAIRDQIFFFLRETASSSQIESILGTWCMAAHDIDRSVSTTALKSWNNAISTGLQQDNTSTLSLDERLRASLTTFIQRTVLDPNGVYMYLNPTPPVVPPAPTKKGARKEDPELAARSKAEELEENEQDRRARLRVGAIGAIRWTLEMIPTNPANDLADFFTNPALWSSLHHAENCTFIDIESFGHGQPNVRKSAWSLVQTLLKHSKGYLERLLPVLGPSILRSAWVEPDTTVHGTMWQPLLTFLKEFPGTWELERTQEYNKDDEVVDDSDSDDSDTQEKKVVENTQNPPDRPSLSYQEFLRFLELGCSGSPQQGYPTVVIVISTIPSSILASTSSPDPLADLFSSFWKVLEGRVLSSLHRSTSSTAFLSALFECMVFLIKRVRSDTQNHGALLMGTLSTRLDVNEVAKQIVREQMKRVWAELVGKRLKVEQRAAARLTGQTLISLNDIAEGLFGAAWGSLSTEIEAATESSPSLVAIFLKIFQDRFKNTTTPRAASTSLLADILTKSLKQCNEALTGEATETTPATQDMSLLVNMIDQFREGLFDDVEFSHLIDGIIVQHAFRLLNISPSLILAYLSYRKQEEQCLRVWQSILSGISQNPDISSSSIAPLLDAAQRGSLPDYLKPSAGEVDGLVEHLLAQVLSGDATHSAFITQVLQNPDYFLSEDGYSTLLDNVINTFTHHFDAVLCDSEVSLPSFEPALGLMSVLSQHQPRVLQRKDFDILIPNIFVFSHLLPRCYDEGHVTFDTAKGIWDEWLKVATGDSKVGTLAQVKGRLKTLLSHTGVRPSSRDILHVMTEAPPELGFKLLIDIFPVRGEIETMLSQLSPDPIHPSLAVIDSLIPPADAFMIKKPISQSYDSRGFSAYARVVDALLQVLSEDRQAAKQNVWALRHLHALEIYAQDFQHISSPPSPLFAPTAISTGLDTIVRKVEQVTTYILTSPLDDGWRGSALDVVLNNKPTEALGDLPLFLVDTISRARDGDLVRDTRILRNILQHIFHDIEKSEADLWMLLARKLESKAPQTCMTIVSAITEYAPEPPRLDRYRNELAAAVFGVSSSKANTEGLLTLRKLAASAPSPDSDVVFLPQPRAVNIMKACQRWISSDDDIDEDVESEMTLIFFYLAPILQDLSGAHWDLVFDVLENNLENSSLTDDTALVVLARSLRLIILIQDLALTNKSLRADWQERKLPILTTVRDLATISFDHLERSTPLSTCRGLVLTIIQTLPESLVDQETLPKMSHLILDASTDVQKMAYLFLQKAAKKRTEYLVIEAGVDVEATVKADLPTEILDMLRRDVVVNQTSETDEENMFGYLLGWMILFDLFQEASLRVRSNYIEQLRNLNIIVSHFIPTLLSLLRLDQGPLKTFKLDIWAVDEFHIEFYDSAFSLSLPILAAHLYYRALMTVPSLIHTWVLDCKDRQLSSSITNYTSQYFSPVIIQTELAHVKSPESTALLVDENLTIKVATAVNEVVASYLVDEHQLEIKLKIPTDWPLHKIEVRDVKRVGVDESRWRAWILAVQQIIWSHNGRIVDGLSLFKKNVTLHFEGQVECAICYSIISVSDGTLPKKPCKTCKNRFHAACLYKWFNTSHSSSCPLCRSDIF